MTGYVGGPDLFMKHDYQPVLRYILIFYNYKKKENTELIQKKTWWLI